MFQFFSNATCVERRLIFSLSTRTLRCYICNKLSQNAWLWNDESINDQLISAIPFSLPLPLPLPLPPPPPSPSFTWFQYIHHCKFTIKYNFYIWNSTHELYSNWFGASTSDTRATNLQTQAITPDIMSQDLTRLEKTMEATNKKQS